jgi:hypothetical protein
MSRLTTNRHLATALLKTLSALEEDTSLDAQDPAFIHIKCTLLQRLLSLHVDTAEIKSSLHLVESPDPQCAGSAAPDAVEDSAIA